MRLAIRKAKKVAFGLGISQSESKKTAENALAKEQKKCLAAEAAGEGENQQLR